jgi:hypothetical protein
VAGPRVILSSRTTPPGCQLENGHARAKIAAILNQADAQGAYAKFDAQVVNVYAR